MNTVKIVTKKNIAAFFLISLLVSGCTVRPKPFTKDEESAQIQKDHQLAQKGQQPLNGSLTLTEAIARAIRYNLKHHIKAMEEAIAQDQIDIAFFDLMPKLSATHHVTNRSKPSASSSYSISRNEESLETSTSQDRNKHAANMTLTWNLLDFGVSYFQARQEADRFLIAQERRRKVAQNLAQKVRFAYWKAVSAQRMESKINKALKKAAAAFKSSETIEKDKLRPPLEALQYRRTLLELVHRLELLQAGLTLAQTELAALINLKPGIPIQLADSEKKDLPALELRWLPKAMEEMALRSRPELREARYKTRISVNETQKAIAKLLPGIEFSLGGHYDSNSYTLHKKWREAGLQVTWNLMNVFSSDRRLKWAKSQEALSNKRRLALHMAVLSQLHVSYHQYQTAKQSYLRSKTLSQIDSEIFRHVSQQQAQDSQGELKAIRSLVNAVSSQLQHYEAYAKLQDAVGRLRVSLGLDPLPTTINRSDLISLSKAIAEQEKLYLSLSPYMPPLDPKKNTPPPKVQRRKP